ncbi:hypothetical protein A9Q86_09135 [Flavobacteriales bacterium 33_180_T64]|nr:hypothetical protein A9Q86_09135 [Flavobacteriales bacterium 33_180_T64]
MKQSIYIILLAFITILSCDRIKSKTQETINAESETAAEFVEGIDKTLEVKIKLSTALEKKGLKMGKYAIEDNPLGGTDNLLRLYIIFDNDFEDILYVNVFDKKGLEAGRAKLEVKGEKGHADYFEFTFNKHIEIEFKSSIVIE